MRSGLLGRFMRRGRTEREPTLVIVGLGNPGPKYAGTRHNAGFMCVDVLAGRAGIALNDKRRAAFLGEGRLGGRRIVLVKPRTFMNVSGEAVRYAMDRYRVRAESVLIVLDDLDLPLGRVRMRASGGSGGHNGLNSINAALGTQDYARLRIGIGRPQGETVGYVLGAFSPEEAPDAEAAIARAADAAEAWLAHGVNYAMDNFN
ncbi:MAG: aminoacyl-tRNA hydrolase [Chloroflexota bacterium]|nr:aminoacyl-tRNA hydrolase [Chloroflexota bacterium]MDE2886002.1 aminoacyl-tRNA hydrolase [Chloroflexota bacterium]